MDGARQRRARRAVRDVLLAYEQLAAAWRRRHSISANEEIVLVLLASGVVAPTDLSRTIGMTTAGMTNLLDRLEDEGLVRREPHATDGRRVLVTLTKKGVRVWRELDEASDIVAELLEQLDVATCAAVVTFLDQSAAVVQERAEQMTGETANPAATWTEAERSRPAR